MRVLLLNTYPRGGGAAVAAERTMLALQGAGIEVRMLTVEDFPQQHKVAFLAEKLDTFRVVRYDRSRLFRFSPASFGVNISKHPWIEWADVIHIHWVQQGFLSLRGIEELLQLKEKKIFWTLHDFWALTGGCHMPYISDGEGNDNWCHAFQTHCGHCPLTHSKKLKDRAFRVFEAKSRMPLERIHLLGVSEKMVRFAKQSPLFREARISLLHNMIDLERYQPSTERSLGERRILFVAARLDDPIKGMDRLKDALRIAVRHSEHFEREAHLILVGKVKNTRALDGIPIKYTVLDELTQEELIAEYQRASVTVSASRFETFGLTLLESIACGTPVVAFDVGGISDIVNEANGRLIAPYNVEEMALAIIENSELHLTRDRQSIARSVSAFGTDQIVRQLIALYTN